jgi:hypothetical protein
MMQRKERTDLVPGGRPSDQKFFRPSPFSCDAAEIFPKYKGMTKVFDRGLHTANTAISPRNIPRAAAALVLAAGLSFLAPTEANAAGYGVNLLVNGNAENGLVGWNQTGSPAIVQYGAAGGFPTTTDPGPFDRGKAFFAGGSTASSSFNQLIDVSANAADIDAGKVACDVEAWLGGYLNDGDSANFNVIFVDGGGSGLANIFLGPVTTADRSGKTGLLETDKTVSVPAGTRRIYAAVVMTRDPNNGGAYNDGYADSLSVVLRGPIVVTTTADSGAGSLRTAIAGGTTITFDPGVFSVASTPHVITLLSALPDLGSQTVISGPGSKVLTVQRSTASGTPNFRVFNISDSTSSITILGLTISNGLLQGANFGPGIQNVGTLTLNDVVVTGCMSSGAGGGITNYGSLTLTSSVVSSNHTLDRGGGIYNSSSLVLKNSSVSGNQAGIDGGGIFNIQGTVSMNNSTISGNAASGSSGNTAGAAIHNESGTLSATGCTISENSGTASSSSIVYASLGSLSLANCTISDNSVTSGDTILAGGPSGTIIGLFNDTIAGNFASNSVHSDGSSKISFNNTIFADSGPTFSSTNGGTFSPTGYNLSTHNDKTVLNQTSDLNSSDPKLGPLQDNGGPTFTRALLPGSMAIDKGDSIFAIDQRGAPRPVDDPNSTNAGNGNNPTDIGAFEFQGTPPVVLANISGRLPVGTGDNALFAGFIVTGYQPKRVIMRAIGPSLGVAGGLADPTLELRDGSGALLQSNDNWKDSPNKQAIIDSTIAPTNDLESAIVATLPASKLGTSYTAIVRGSGNATGIGVVEVYDLDRSLDSKLANISNRGFVQTGDNVLFAGNIVVGQTPQKVIIRALGPSTGVPGAMADPTLELHDANGSLLEANDNWVDSPNKQAIIDSTIPPSNNLESAIVRTLSPANYTAIVRGANNTTGIAVVEVYALQ